MNAVPCFKCGREMLLAVPEKPEPQNQPSEGTAFMTTGHWGSTYFDSIMGTEAIEIALCDNCLRANESAVFGPYKRI